MHMSDKPHARAWNEPVDMELPKEHEFLGLVACSTPYWDIFFYVDETSGIGIDRPTYLDRGLYEMPKILRWVELPDID